MDTTAPLEEQALDSVLNVRISSDVKTRFRTRARAEHRSPSDQARLLIEQYLATTEAAA
jgi:hypothetical protein